MIDACKTIFAASTEKSFVRHFRSFWTDRKTLFHGGFSVGDGGALAHLRSRTHYFLTNLNNVLAHFGRLL